VFGVSGGILLDRGPLAVAVTLGKLLRQAFDQLSVVR